jgi:hypothetical protein
MWSLDLLFIQILLSDMAICTIVGLIGKIVKKSASCKTSTDMNRLFL